MYNVSDTMTSLSMDSDIFSTVGLNSLQDKGVSYKKAVGLLGLLKGRFAYLESVTKNTLQ